MCLNNDQSIMEIFADIFALEAEAIRMRDEPRICKLCREKDPCWFHKGANYELTTA